MDIPKPIQTKRARCQAGFVVGRAAFEAIAAVEGIRPSLASQARAAEFDRRGLSDDARRQAIIDAHRPKA